MSKPEPFDLIDADTYVDESPRDEVTSLRARVAELEAALAEKTGEAERQYDYNVSQIARVAKLERALKDIAKQKLDGEMDDDGPWGSNHDFVEGYEQCVKTARAALSETVEA